MPIYRRLPKRGFKNPTRADYAVVNLGRLQAAIDAGRIDAGQPVDAEVLVAAGLCAARGRRPPAGQGELESGRDARGGGRLQVPSPPSRRRAARSSCWARRRQPSCPPADRSRRMASVAEQLAANINFGVFAKATELKKRLWFTLGCLIVYRLGTYIPLPGIDPAVMARSSPQQRGGILGMFDMFSGGALERMTIFALNIMPYISASIIMQLMTRDLADAGGPEEGGRERPQEDQPVYPLPDCRAGAVQA